MHHNRITAPRLKPIRRAVLRMAVAATLVGSLALTGCAGFPGGKPAENVRGGYAAGDKLTVILPGKDPFAEAAAAVREGVRAALGADNTTAKPELRFVEVDQPDQVPQAVSEAVKSGATYVIGPLQKPAVDALASGAALKVPTLALNQSTQGRKAAANLYQFALAPDTEAAEVANQARAMGFSRALMLYPQGDAGKRRADAFRIQWKRLGGTVAGESAFDPAAADYKDLVTALTGNQADFLFLAADSAEALKIYPLVRGGAGAALRVIATSDVYPGEADRARDKELAGLYFVDLPWVLGVGADQDPLARSKRRSSGSALSTPLGLRLYAMGIDAYRLAPRLTAMAKDPSLSLSGATGILYVDSLDRVQRQLALGRFTENGPEPVAGSAIPRSGAGEGTARPEAIKPAKPAQPAPAPSEPARQAKPERAEPRQPSAG